jgi:hypothetical protein
MLALSKSCLLLLARGAGLLLAVVRRTIFRRTTMPTRKVTNHKLLNEILLLLNLHNHENLTQNLSKSQSRVQLLLPINKLPLVLPLVTVNDQLQMASK